MCEGKIREYFQRVFIFFNGNYGITLIGYLFFIIAAQAFLKGEEDISFLMVFILVLLMCIGPVIFRKAKRLKIILQEKKISRKEKILWVLFFFILCFAVLIQWYLAYFPGVFTEDAVYQYKQALSGQYSDWKPIIQTLITFTLPIKLTGVPESIVLFQIIEYSCILAYMAYVMMKYSNQWFALAALAYILLNPATGNMAVSPYRDFTFAMFTILLMAFGIQIYMTHGGWLESKRAMVIFTIVLAIATLVRHNGFMFTVPFLVAVLIWMNKKGGIRIFFLFLICTVVLKGPVRLGLEGPEPWNHTTRLMGLPMSVLGNVAKESPESLDEQTKEFMYSVASPNEWENVYQCGKFNSIKWQCDQVEIEEAGPAKILWMTAKAIFRAPVPALKGAVSLTDMVYTINGDMDWDIQPYMAENELGLEFKEIYGRRELETYTYFFKTGIFKYIFWYVGIINLFIIFSVLCKQNERRKILFALPLLCYNFGTMLLLSGNDFRYFYLNFPLIPMIIFMLFGNMNEKQEDDRKEEDYNKSDLKRNAKRIYDKNRIVILLSAGFTMGMILLLLALGSYSNCSPTDQALAEYFTQFGIVVLNAAPVALLVLLFYFLTGRAWLAFLAGSGIPMLLSLGNYFKICFRDDPLYFEDILLLREAQNMVIDGGYSLFVDKQIAIAAVSLILGTGLFYFFDREVLKGWKIRISRAVIVGVIMLAFFPGYLDNIVYSRIGKYTYLEHENYTHRYIAHGFVYPFIHSISEFIGTAPEGYSPAKAEELLSRYKDADIPEDKKMNIIAIMREAYMDFSRFEVEGLNRDYCSLYHQLEEESYTGDLLTNAAYGFTVYTERNFLTGNTRFKNYRGNTNSYPWYFREQGYTVEGSHPYYQWFYNRRNVNGFLGFERYRFWENDYETLTDKRLPEDEILFSEIYKDYENNKADRKPYFSFNVTVESHGPYDSEKYNGDIEYLTGDYSEECKNVVNNYSDVIMQSDKELMKLIEKLRKDPEPIILVTFGDHLPWMGNGNEFYQEMGINIDTSTEEGFRNYYSTRYLIWANNAARKRMDHYSIGEGVEISPCYLMNLIFQQIGWEGPAYMQAMEDMMDVFPVVTTNERYVVDGILSEQIPEERQELFQDYLYLQEYWQKEFMFEP